MPAVSRECFAEQVLDALPHLYDHVYLQRHPLSQLLAVGPSDGARGRTLHRILIEAIGQLKPSRDTPQLSLSWRKYQYFALRYLEGQSALEAADSLAISERQARRYHHEMVEALVAELWEMYTAIASRVGKAISDGYGSDDEHTRRQDDRGWHSLLREEVGRLEAASEGISVELSEALNSVLTAIGSFARSRQVNIEADLSADLPPVALDRVLLRQVLFNLLVHGTYCQRPGRIRLRAYPGPAAVHIELYAEREAGRETGALRETGDESARELSWKAGEQLEAARELIASAQGSLEVGSGEPGRWLLRLTLPATRPISVLVVDDNPDIISLFRRFLSGRPYQVLEASRAAEALEITRRLRPQVIVLDVMMPGQDGWELLQLLRNLPENLNPRVLVCSVLRERELALALGATGFLAKPVTQRALLAALESCLAASPAPPALL